jgi:hypothetical protein
MSITSHRPNEEAYEVMSQTDEDDRPLSASSVADVSKLLGSKSAIVQMDRVQPVGSLSRNEHNSWYFVGHGAVDAILTLGPVLFLGIVLGFPRLRRKLLMNMIVVPGMCLGLNNKPISAHGQTVKAITLLSPTIFPIVYAAILGRMLRRVGLFKAERGTTLGVSVHLASIFRRFLIIVAKESGATNRMPNCVFHIGAPVHFPTFRPARCHHFGSMARLSAWGPSFAPPPLNQTSNCEL